eukprot:8581711-Lingulodinium_polyedra.AAC.1
MHVAQQAHVARVVRRDVPPGHPRPPNPILDPEHQICIGNLVRLGIGASRHDVACARASML